VARSRSGVTEGAVNGWAALYLTNGALAVTVLPGKGADIYEITDLATGIDPLFKAPWGLQPPGAEAREGSDGAAFLENYEGAWQELLPNTNDACTHHGTPVPFHGEVATKPWSVAVEADDGEHVAVRLSVDCETVPLRLERLMTLRSGQRRLEWDPGVFGWIISWQPYGGARAMPLRGSYALGIEPWAAGGNLEHAVATGSALRLDGHAHLDTRLTASFRPC
jgi:hypothetical protein